MLTSQLFFPDEEQNAGDNIYDPSLEMDLDVVDDGEVGYFTFVLATGD